MKPTRYLSNVRYAMALGCGLDSWRIHGICDGKPICPGFPVEVDTDNHTIETSRSIYIISDYDCNEIEFWNQVHKDMENGGFEVH